MTHPDAYPAAPAAAIAAAALTLGDRPTRGRGRVSAGRPKLDADLAAALEVLCEAFKPGQVEVVCIQRHALPNGRVPAAAAPVREGTQASLLDPEGWQP
jgi:hypothetical protein